MKLRPPSTTSECQLVRAMADMGRPVSLAELAVWRQDGLLPPLASQGRGQGKGKTYYWREGDILAHACTAFDFLAHYGRSDIAIWMLFLSGYSVPLPQLRRAWAYRGKSRKTALARPTTAFAQAKSDASQSLGLDGTASFLLTVALTLSGAVTPDDSRESPEILGILRRALSRVTRARGARALPQAGLAEQLWHTVTLLAATLETSNLVRETSDADLADARHYLCIAARLLHICEEGNRGNMPAGPDLWSAWLAERAGPPLLLLILVLLRAGQRSMLEDIARDIEHASRSDTSPPARMFELTSSIPESGRRMTRASGQEKMSR